MKATISTFAFALIAGVASAQERCDAPYPNVYCNTTDTLAFKSDDCKPFHVFVARGSDEPFPGRLGNLTRRICESIGDTSQCGYEDIDYPAKSTGWGKEEWCKSAGKGAANGQAQLKQYSSKCPTSKLILLGFSQGASVALDILGGGGGPVFDCEQPMNGPLDESTGRNVAAAVVFGAVSRSRGQNYTVGGGDDFDGRRPRTEAQIAALSKYSARLQDYCHFGDPMCAVGSEPADPYIHLDYFLQHNEEVAAWVAKAAKASNGQSSYPTSAIAKSAAFPSATPSAIQSTTDTSEASAQTGTTGEKSDTGAASALAVSTSYAPYVAVVAAALFFSL